MNANAAYAPIRRFAFRSAVSLIIACVVLAAPSGARAQTGGEPVVTGPGPRLPLAYSPDGAGGVSTVYIEDHRLFLTHLRADHTLESEWPGGVLLATGPTSFFFPRVHVGNKGDLFLAWIDDSLRVQRVIIEDAGIAPGWPAAGRTLCAPIPGFAQFFGLELGVDATNTARLFWDVNFDASNQVASAGVGDDAAILQSCQLMTCGDGQFLASVTESDGQFVASYSAYGFASGEPAQTVGATWAPASVSHRPYEEPFGGQCLPSGGNLSSSFLAPSSGGDVILAFRRGDGSIGAQRLTPDPSSFFNGEVWSPGGITLFPTSPGNPVRGASDGAGGAFFLYQQFGSGTQDLIVQAILAGGTIPAGWPASGVAFAHTTDGFEPGGMIHDGAGGALIGWARRVGNDRSVHAQHVLADGTIDPLWPVGGIEIATLPGSKGPPELVTDGAGGAYLAWFDQRAGNPDIYAQHVSHDGQLLPTVGVEPPPVAAFALSRGFPNPTKGAIAFHLTLPEDGRVVARVLDVAGRVVARVADDAFPAGEHALVWNGRRADGSLSSSGIYMLEVRGGGRVATGRIVRL